MGDQYNLFDGNPPSQKHSPTSIAAAAAIKSKVGPLHQEILAYLHRVGSATDEEMQDNIPMRSNTQRPRRRELELMGRIENTGRMRLTSSLRLAVVWKVAGPRWAGPR